jgi:hypothetical protein
MAESLAAYGDRQIYSRHPQTLAFAWPPGTHMRQYFLKVFHRRRGLSMFKDLLRGTKARRFWRQGLALSAAGFNVPLTIACGEKTPLWTASAVFSSYRKNRRSASPNIFIDVGLFP